MIDDVEREVAQRFGLGASAAPLVQAFLGLVETDFPGGWEGVLARFRRQGYGLEVASWLGTGEPAAIDPQGLDEVFGSETLSFLSERTGVNEATVADVIAFILPTVVRRLKAPSGVGVRPPAWAAGTLSTTHRPNLAELDPSEPEDDSWRSPVVPEAEDLEPEDFTESQEPVHETTVVDSHPAWSGWVTPIALASVVAMIAIFASGGGNLVARTKVAEEKPPTRVLSAAANRQEGRLLPPTLTLRQAGSSWTYFGVVNREDEKERVVEALEKLGAMGSLEVDPGVDPSHWHPFILELTREVPQGLQFTFEGRIVTLSGLPSAELTRWANVLQDRITKDLEVRVLNLEGNSSDANKVVESEISRLETEGVTDPDQILETLNKQVINFRSGSATVPATNRSLLERAGRLLAGDPSESMITVVGYTDSTGSESGNLRISQRRAREVAEILVSVGVRGERIRAEGRGEADPIASNDTVEGRFANRRIEFVLEPN